MGTILLPRGRGGNKSAPCVTLLEIIKLRAHKSRACWPLARTLRADELRVDSYELPIS